MNTITERRSKPRTLPSRLIRLDEVKRICGLSRASIYGAIKRGTFPPAVKLGRASAWVKQEVEAWVEEQIACTRRKDRS